MMAGDTEGRKSMCARAETGHGSSGVELLVATKWPLVFIGLTQ